MDPAEKELLDNERYQLLARLEGWLETPMIVLGFVWLALLILEFTSGLTPLLESIGVAIWIVFILDFVLRFSLAPKKRGYLRRSWLTAIALLIPALRVFKIAQVLRVMQAARAVRGVRLLRVITSLNRGMRALGNTMGRRGFGYVMALTLIVTLAGAAGMVAFESDLPGGQGLDDYSSALWWTAMVMTTLGSEYWPQTAEGRLLGLILSVYAIAVFGYLTATLASFFIGRDAASSEGEVAGTANLEALHAEIAALRAELRAFSQKFPDA